MKDIKESWLIMTMYSRLLLLEVNLVSIYGVFDPEWQLKMNNFVFQSVFMWLGMAQCCTDSRLAIYLTFV